MPEETQVGSSDEPVGKVDDPMNDKVTGDLEASLNTDDKPPEDSDTENQGKVLDEYGVDPKSLPEDSKERDKVWRSHYTKKTQEYSNKLRDLEGKLENIANQNTQYQQVFAQPDVYKAAQKAYGQNNGQQDLEQKLDPESKKVLDQYFDAKINQVLQPYTQSIQQLTVDQRAIKDGADLNKLAEKGFPVDDENFLLEVDQLLEQNPNLGMIGAAKSVAYDNAESRGKEQQLNDITKKANTRVHRPGMNSSNNAPVDDKSKSLLDIFNEEARK